MGKTLTEKILSAHLVDGEMIKGKEIGIRIDQTLTQDATGTMAYLEFEAMGIDRVRTEKSLAYIDHNTLQCGFENADDHRFIASIAKKHGIKVVLNPAPAREYDKSFLDDIYLFTPNEHETFGIENRDNVVVTLGKRGCLIKESDTVIPAVDVGKVLDTTGAGDTFNGVLAAMLSQGEDLENAVKRANLASSIGVTRKYAVSSIPTYEEIKKYI